MIFRLLRMVFPNSILSGFMWLLVLACLAYTFVGQVFTKEMLGADVLAIGGYVAAWTLHDRE